MDDERPEYTCFNTMIIPSETLPGFQPVCIQCRIRVLLGVVFMHIGDENDEKCPLYSKWNMSVRRPDIYVLCQNCFLDRVELCFVEGESEEYQFAKIKKFTIAHTGTCFPAFKERLRLNKSKSARK